MKKRLLYFLMPILALAGLIFAPHTTSAVIECPDGTTAPTLEECPTAPENPETPATTTPEEDSPTTDATCYDQVGGIGWLICPATGALSKGIDAIYGAIENLIRVNPISTESDSPIYMVWEYVRNITNIIFIIFILVVVFSQLTGLGITNYGIKKVLPRIIIAAILVNLSYIVCVLAVDISNILGTSLGSVFDGIYQTAAGSESHTYTGLEIGGTVTAALAGTALAGGIAFATGAIWMLLPVIFAGFIAVLTAFLTMAARQALIVILIMIAPLAFVAYLLPNTEKWFSKWKDLLIQMLIFYPMFTVLFSASQIASWVIINSATNAFGIILGIAVQLLPLFAALPMLKMSKTLLGKIGDTIQNATKNSQDKVRTYAGFRRDARRAAWMENNRGAMSWVNGSRLANFLTYRHKLTEKRTADDQSALKDRVSERISKKLEKPSVIPGIVEKENGTKTLARGQRANRFMRSAKRAGTTAMQSAKAESSVKNKLSEYSKHYASKADQSLATTAGQAFVDLNVEEFRTANNEEADFNHLLNVFTKAAKEGPGGKDYEKYLVGATGDLGSKGISSVLGQMIAKADAIEQRRRKQNRILLNKYGFTKGIQRDMLVGYYRDDDGFATDENGNRLKETDGSWTELVPGELVLKDPSRLVRFWQKDENGELYYDWKDQQGKLVMRAYRNDRALMKEVLSGDDIPINDNINSLYGILAGMYPEQNDGIGLADYSTTIGRALQASNYKEKNAGFGAQAIASIGRRQVKTYAHLAIETLDNIKKTAKPGNWNTQDQIAMDYYATIIDPTNFRRLFTEEAIKDFENVNGEPLKGLAENGTIIPAEEAEYEDKLRQIKAKYINPAAKKIAKLMSRLSYGAADNQKPGAEEGMSRLEKILDKYYTGDPKFPSLTNAYEQPANGAVVSARIKNKIKHHSGDMSDLYADLQNDTGRVDLRFVEDHLFGVANSTDDIISALRDYLEDDNLMANALDELNDWAIDNPMPEEEHLLDFWHDLLEKHLGGF